MVVNKKKQMRKVLGEGLLVLQNSTRSLPQFITLINHVRVDSAKLDDVEYAFLVNPNMHRQNRRLRGLLCCTTTSIGVIVRANINKAIYLPLQPTGKIECISLCSQVVEPLQQIKGKPLSLTYEKYGARIDVTGQYFAMSPAGPDKCHLSCVSIPALLEKAISPLPSNTTRHKLVGRKLKNNSCLYVCVNDATRLAIVDDDKEMYLASISENHASN